MNQSRGEARGMGTGRVVGVTVLPEFFQVFLTFRLNTVSPLQIWRLKTGLAISKEMQN